MKKIALILIPLSTVLSLFALSAEKIQVEEESSCTARMLMSGMTDSSAIQLEVSNENGTSITANVSMMLSCIERRNGKHTIGVVLRKFNSTHNIGFKFLDAELQSTAAKLMGAKIENTIEGNTVILVSYQDIYGALKTVTFNLNTSEINKGE